MEQKEKLDKEVVTHHMERVGKGKKKIVRTRCVPNYPFIIFFLFILLMGEQKITFQKQSFTHYLDSELYKSVFKISNRTGIPSIFRVYSFFRATIPTYFTSTPDNITVVDRFFQTKDNLSFPIRIFIPKEVKKGITPSFVWIHGSNFLYGQHNQEPDASLCRFIASHGILVFSISYRSSESFPNPLLDVLEGIKWVYHNTHEFGGERTLLSLGGHDAGGNLAAAATWHIRDQNDDIPSQKDVKDRFPEDLEVKFLGIVNPMMMIPFHLVKNLLESYRHYKDSGFFIDFEMYEYIFEKYLIGETRLKEISSYEKELIMNSTVQNYLAFPAFGLQPYFLPDFFIAYSQHVIFRDEVLSFLGILKKSPTAKYEELTLDHQTLLSWDPQLLAFEMAIRIMKHFEKNIYVKD